MSAPIIFCHYGNTDYLKYSLQCALLNNPGKNIILLGDTANRQIALECRVTHYLFEDLDYGEEIEQFNAVYRLIQGKKHDHKRGGKDWVNFVFKRYFYLYNYLSKHNVGSFWHFDSDTMIVNSLGQFEPGFAGYDCTEQCNGMCMNGFIASSDIVKRYIIKINELFKRESYIAQQQQEFESANQGFAFTEMRAYQTFKEEEKIKTVRLNRIVNNFSFDDCLCQEHGMKMEPLPSGHTCKKIYLAGSGQFFFEPEKAGSKPVQINTLNLSWLPLYVFHIVMEHSKHKAETQLEELITLNKTPTLAQQNFPLLFRLKYLFSRIQTKITKLL